MKSDHRHTLSLPFENGLLALPKKGEQWGFLNASPLPLDLPSSKSLICEQGFRPEFLALEQAGYEAHPELENNASFTGMLLLTGRVRAVNEANLARAWHMTKEGGTVIVCGEKNSGIGAIRKWAGEHCTLIDSLSKNHAIVFWFQKTGDTAVFPASTKTAESVIAPGMFSADGPDLGSQILVKHFDKRIFGKIADFGAGWGYLSSQLLASDARIEQLDLYEADHLSLQAARKLIAADKAANVMFHWTDLISEYKKKPYNWVIMNPPFHHGLQGGRAADPRIGQTFIQTAASTLVQGGRLLMVANRNLPYEAVLEKAFRRVIKLEDANGFKVFEAMR